MTRVSIFKLKARKNFIAWNPAAPRVISRPICMGATVYVEISTMRVLRLPDLSWLYPVLSVFLWTIDFTHGVLEGEECAIAMLTNKRGSRPHLIKCMKIPLPEHMAVNLLFILWSLWLLSCKLECTGGLDQLVDLQI